MAKLDGKHKRFIVVSLAYYETPSQVAAAVKEEFNVVVTRQQVAFFDPTTRQSGNKKPSKEYVDLFTETRATLDAKIDSIPINKQSFRLLAIQRIFRAAEASNNRVLALQALKQAAEEGGGAYTNTRRLEGTKGAPIVHEHRRSIEDYTDAELADLAAAAGATGAAANSE